MRRAAVAGVVLLLAGCGGSSSPPLPPLRLTAQQAHGKRLFTEKCAVCHRLADADAHGTAGPNLDKTAWTDAQVLTAIAKGPGAMPNLVAGTDAQAVAAYVVAATSARRAPSP